MTVGNSPSRNPSVAVTMVTAQPEHIKQLQHWFRSRQEMFVWGGPGMRYPTNHIYFIRDIGWLKLASIALIAEHEVLITSEQQSLFGFAQIYARLNRYHFGRVAISPGARGQGLGYQFLHKLMQGIIQSAGQNPEQFSDAELHPEGFVDPESQSIVLPFKATEFSLFVLDDNIPAINCYKKLGFEVADYPEPMPGGMRNCLYMVRSLDR